MSANIFNDTASASIGPRLTNIQNQSISSSKMLVYDSNNTVSQINFNPAISSILNQSSLDALKTILLENNEEAIVFQSDNNNIIEFHTGLAGGSPDASNLRMEITNTDTTIKNNLKVDNIKDEAGNQSINITSGQLTLQRPKITFRDSAFTNRGYLQTQNSGDSDGDNTTGYLEWYTGLNARCAYMGLGGSNELSGVSGKTLSLSLEQNCNFKISQGATEIFKVSVEDDIIIANYNFRINVPNDNTFALYVAPFLNQVCLYSAKQYPNQNPSGLLVQGLFEVSDTNQERCALKINNYSNGGFRPMMFNSANLSKIIFGSQNFHSSDSQNFIVDSEALFTTNVSTHGDLKTYHIYPDIATSGSPDFVTSIYSLGQDERRWLDIYSKNSPTHGSDIRLKTDIKPLDFNSLDTILKLEPVLFKWKANQSGRNHIGFIAQSIEKIEELRNTGFFCKSKSGSTISLRTNELIPVLVGGIQQLKGEHDKLKELINELLDKHKELFNQVKEDDPFENLKLLISENNIDKPIGDDEQVKLNKEKLIDLERKIQILDDAKDEHKCGELTILKEDIEQLCESKDALEQELFKFKTQNQILEQRIIELENIDYHQQPVETAPVVDNNQLVLLKNRIDILEERDMLDDSDATQTSQIDIIMSRLNLLESENKKLKAKVAKQTTIINKILTNK